ncbi:NRDE family protein [Aquiflexum sp. TKW24L]|uniref:NRDE family protein n=1 Tax=Aquiflexum sp. TKW24L TaxID=2942212 RepID=UPI0020BD69B3|nr:NRDE family protein [Aquiflexum sp. TKW24L]MCL6260651.1 NRDE family protein [Aquiflexum sp. TKW24L]
MCLLAFNWNNHPEYKFILVANRDEFFERPTASIHLWEQGFYAGKDLKAGGTWLGLHPNGRFATLTNHRDLKNLKPDAKSRGNLVKDFLEGNMVPLEYLQEIEKEKDQYDGFNLLVGSGDELFYLSNKKEGIFKLENGLYGLSNALLETPWAKLVKAKEKLHTKIDRNEIDPDGLREVLLSREIEPDRFLPVTGATLEQERLLSSQFINVGNYYGTINTTVLLWKHSGEVEIKEVRYFQAENRSEENQVQFHMDEVREQNIG